MNAWGGGFPKAYHVLAQTNETRTHAEKAGHVLRSESGSFSSACHLVDSIREPDAPKGGPTPETRGAAASRSARPAAQSGRRLRARRRTKPGPIILRWRLVKCGSGEVAPLVIPWRLRRPEGGPLPPRPRWS